MKRLEQIPLLDFEEDRVCPCYESHPTTSSMLPEKTTDPEKYIDFSRYP
jgi:hypothetical protein